MNIDEFPGCCGAKVLTGWYSSVRATEKVVKRLVSESEDVDYGDAFLTAILTEEQAKMYARVLKNNGFVRKGTGINSSTGSKLLFFLRSRKSKRATYEQF